MDLVCLCLFICVLPLFFTEYGSHYFLFFFCPYFYPVEVETFTKSDEMKINMSGWMVERIKFSIKDKTKSIRWRCCKSRTRRRRDRKGKECQGKLQLQNAKSPTPGYVGLIARVGVAEKMKDCIMRSYSDWVSLLCCINIRFCRVSLASFEFSPCILHRKKRKIKSEKICR